MKHPTERREGESEWQQMTRHCELLNNAWKSLEHEEPTTEGRYADGGGETGRRREREPEHFVIIKSV